MAIDRLLQNSAFGPEEIAAIVAAYEDVCRQLHLSHSRYAAATELIARKVLDVAQTGVRNPVDLAALVLAEIEGASSATAPLP